MIRKINVNKKVHSYITKYNNIVILTKEIYERVARPRNDIRMWTKIDTINICRMLQGRRDSTV